MVAGMTVPEESIVISFGDALVSPHSISFSHTFSEGVTLLLGMRGGGASGFVHSYWDISRKRVMTFKGLLRFLIVALVAGALFGGGFADWKWWSSRSPSKAQLEGEPIATRTIGTVNVKSTGSDRVGIAATLAKSGIYSLVSNFPSKMVIDLEEKDYGGKAFSCSDPEGHVWHCWMSCRFRRLRPKTSWHSAVQTSDYQSPRYRQSCGSKPT
jgi:hypothetical protein